jgi:hypothetical protein
MFYRGSSRRAVVDWLLDLALEEKRPMWEVSRRKTTFASVFIGFVFRYCLVPRRI